MSKTLRYVATVIITVIIMVAGFVVPQNNNIVSDYRQVKFLIGMSHPNLIEEWQISVHDEMEAYSSRYDNVKLIYTNAGNSSFKQISDVNKLMDYGIDLLIITVNDAGVLGSVVEEINQKIPVIVLDEDIDVNDYSLLIGPEYYNVGVLGANRVIELSQDEDFNVVSVNGPIEDRVVTTMYSGFLETLNKHSNIEIVGNMYSDWLSNDTKSEFKTMLKEAGSVDAVFVQSNELTVEIIEAMDELNENIPVITVSKYLPDKYLTYMDIGDIDTILYTPVGGKEAIDYAMELLNSTNTSHAVPKRIIMKSITVTEDTKDLYRYQFEREQKGVIGYIETNLFTESNMESIFGDNREVVFYKMDEFLSAGEKALLQKQYFEKLLDTNVDIIIMKPETSSGWQQLIIKAKEQNISVICVGNAPYIDEQLMDSNVFYIGPDFLDQGKKLANYLIQEVYSTNYDIGILEITSNVNMQLTREKTKSLNNQISGYSRINIIDSVEIDVTDSLTIDEQYKELEDSLVKYHEDINVVYLHDAMNVNRIKDILDDNDLSDVIIISSNDSGIVQNNSTIDYQVSPTILYKEQLKLLVDSYYKDNQLKLEKIYLPNNETFRK